MMCDKMKLWFRKTGLPRNIIILEAILLLSAVIVSAYDWRNNASNNVSMLVNILSPLAIILTLGVLIIYTYYTYLLAKYQIIPSASFGLVQSPDDPYHFAFIMSNQSKYPIKCWCNLNATTRGTNLLYKGFYSGDEPRLLQPEDRRTGHFRIKDLLTNSENKIYLLKNEANEENYKQLLHLNVEFWYYPLIDENNVTTIRDPYYFDFRDNKLKPDF